MVLGKVYWRVQEGWQRGAGGR
jgi:hypothetical protein